MPLVIHRRRTNRDEDDSDDTVSLRRRTTIQFGTAQKATVELEEDKFSSYNGLMTWEKFRGFLQEKFPVDEFPNLDPEFSMRRVCEA